MTDNRFARAFGVVGFRNPIRALAIVTGFAGAAGAAPTDAAADWRMAMADCLVSEAATDQAGVIAACGKVAAADDAPDRLRARASVARGQVYSAQGAAALAIEEFAHAIRWEPEDPAAYALRGAVLLAMNDLKGGLADFDVAVMRDPSYAPLRETRAAARFGSGDEAGALEDWRAARRLDPSRYPADATARLLAARAARHLSDDSLTEARVEAEAALARAPGDAVALSVLAAVSAADGNHDASLDLFLAAMRADGAVGRGIELSLAALGYDPGAADGLPSAMTRHALEACLADKCRLFQDPRFRFF